METTPPRSDSLPSKTTIGLGPGITLWFVVLAVFAISFLVTLFLIPGSLSQTQGVLSEDLERSVRRYNNPPRTRGFAVGETPGLRPLLDVEE